MIATAVLSLGSVLIFQSFFSVLRAYEYCSRYISSSSFAYEKLWEGCENVRTAGILPPETAGEFSRSERKYSWNLSLEPAGGAVYKVTVVITWPAEKRGVERSAYVSYEKPA